MANKTERPWELAHRAMVNDPQKGFEPAKLLTTTYGLQLVLRGLQAIEPDPEEVALHKVLVTTLEVNLMYGSNHGPS